MADAPKADLANGTGPAPKEPKKWNLMAKRKAKKAEKENKAQESTIVENKENEKVEDKTSAEKTDNKAAVTTSDVPQEANDVQPNKDMPSKQEKPSNDEHTDKESNDIKSVDAQANEKRTGEAKPEDQSDEKKPEEDRPAKKSGKFSGSLFGFGKGGGEDSSKILGKEASRETVEKKKNLTPTTQNKNAMASKAVGLQVGGEPKESKLVQTNPIRLSAKEAQEKLKNLTGLDFQITTFTTDL